MNHIVLIIEFSRQILSFSLDHIKKSLPLSNILQKLLLMIKWNIFSTWYMEIIETKYLSFFASYISAKKFTWNQNCEFFFTPVVTNKYVYYVHNHIPLILADYCLDSYYRDLIRRLYLYFPTNCLLEHLNSFLQNCCLH